MQSEFPIVPRPTHARVEMTREGDVVTFCLPPQGFDGTPALLMFIGVAFLLAPVVIIFVAIFVDSSDRKDNPGVIMLFLALLFGFLGAVLLTIALYFARKKTVLVLSPEVVTLTQKTIFGTQEKKWPRAQVTGALVCRTVIQVDGEYLSQLRLHMANGGRVGLFTGRPDKELAWLADEIQRETAPHAKTR